MTPRVDLVVSHLVLRRPADFKPTMQIPRGVRLSLIQGEDRGAQSRECYLQVGEPWSWTDRRHWQADEWSAWLNEVDGELWLAQNSEAVVGFFVLRRSGRDVELSYLGLWPDWIGQGIGGWLLGRAVERAWARGAERVTLETCTLDGPAALPNYLDRGFELVREEARVKEWTDESG